MSETRVIRYTTTPETADENERLIRDVFAELAVEQPDGVHYQSIRLADGLDFIHIVTLDGPDTSGATILGAYEPSRAAP
jgi:hypothetical protein